MPSKAKADDKPAKPQSDSTKPGPRESEADDERPSRTDWPGAPTNFIKRVRRRTGKEIPGPIAPDELLVHAHRDRNLIDITAQYLASRIIELTGNEAAVQTGLRTMNALANAWAWTLGTVLRSRKVENLTKSLLGVTDPDVHFEFREPTNLPDKTIEARTRELREEAQARLKARGRNPKLQIFLTGATGFLGNEILVQAAEDRKIAGVTCLMRPEKIRDRHTKKVLEVIPPAKRGANLLERLGIKGTRARKFRFVGGDIEKPRMGLTTRELSRIRKSVTHVIHCAASVAFDDTYENSFQANVVGCHNALELSLAFQEAEDSPFIQHLAIETSYVHGRKKRGKASEHTLLFPRNYYNNFYELTKAMASLETDRYMLEKGLRVTQLLPAIVIGHSRTGNNYGDTKVINAPVNAFGRAKMAEDEPAREIGNRLKARVVAAIALSFPGNRSAEINLVPVDRVVAGILASLTVPEAIGERIHLATDNRIRSKDIIKLARQEIGINVRLVDPTIFRNLTLPVVKATLEKLGEPRLANALDRLGNIFGSYGEWGQPVHNVGNDVRLLGLPIRRPDTTHAFRMLCRHNKYVQEFGRLRDPEEIARRERIWERAIDEIEYETGRQASAMRPHRFRELLAEKVDLRTFLYRDRKKRALKKPPPSRKREKKTTRSSVPRRTKKKSSTTAGTKE